MGYAEVILGFIGVALTWIIGIGILIKYRRKNKVSEPTLPEPVTTTTISEKDKPFYLTLLGAIGMFGSFIAGAFGAYIGNQALIDWAEKGFIAFTGFFSTGFMWYVSKKKD